MIPKYFINGHYTLRELLLLIEKIVLKMQKQHNNELTHEEKKQTPKSITLTF